MSDSLPHKFVIPLALIVILSAYNRARARSNARRSVTYPRTQRCA